MATIVSLGVVGIVLATIFVCVMRLGKKSHELDIARDRLDTIKKAKENEEAIKSMPISDVRKRLSKFSCE